MLARIFVYGTLMPGRLRGELLTSVAVHQEPDAVAGQLYDTGFGWPSARLTAPLGTDPRVDAVPDGNATIPGWTIDVRPDALVGLLIELDQIEGVGGPEADADAVIPQGADRYRRVRVRTLAGHEAWVYEAVAVDLSWTPISGWSSADER